MKKVASIILICIMAFTVGCTSKSTNATDKSIIVNDPKQVVLDFFKYYEKKMLPICPF